MYINECIIIVMENSLFQFRRIIYKIKINVIKIAMSVLSEYVIWIKCKGNIRIISFYTINKHYQEHVIIILWRGHK
jgi:hypothetical protein